MISVFIDGSSKPNPGHKGAGIVICEAGVSTRLSYYLGEGTNSEAEYETLIIALNYLRDNGKLNDQITICSDSQFMVRQMNGQYKASSRNIVPLYRKAKSLFDNFSKIRIRHIERQYNYEADYLANEGADRGNIACNYPVRDLECVK